MTLSRDVIHDLLPLYFADEASGDTRRLVEAYFDDHPGFATDMRAAYRRIHAAAAPPPLAADVELQALDRTRRLLRWKGILLPVAIFLSILPLSVYGNEEGVTFLFQYSPLATSIALACALASWIAYAVIYRTLRLTDLN